jgi:Gluconate 2-dehydrogenase subunit 3
VDRRTTLKWIVAAGAALPTIEQAAWAAGAARSSASPPASAVAAKGYGSDPDLHKLYNPGDLWPLTLSASQRAQVAVLCDVIIPSDEHSPSASAVGVVDFIDEWISAPYPQQATDRAMILPGLTWLDSQAQRRHGATFVKLSDGQRTAICDDICCLDRAKPRFKEAVHFFAKFRNLTAGGFYSSPQGTRDLKYIGNVPLAQFDGPPLELLKKLGLA